MHGIAALIWAGAGGAVLGALFFGGLWWTVRRSLASARPALWILGSLLLRLGLTVTGFWALSDGHWQRLVASLLGFVAARLVATRLSHVFPGGIATPEISHAPES